MPVVIPPFTNVPAPDDPVESAWAQQLTQFAVDQISAGPTAPVNPDAELWYDTADSGLTLPNMPRGYIGYFGQAVPQAGLNVDSDLTSLSISWTADPKRWYKTTLYVVGRQSGALGEQYTYIANGANTALRGSAFNVAANGIVTHSLYIIETNQSGAQTRKGRAGGGAAWSTSGSPWSASISVEDIGGS